MSPAKQNNFLGVGGKGKNPTHMCTQITLRILVTGYSRWMLPLAPTSTGMSSLLYLYLSFPARILSTQLSSAPLLPLSQIFLVLISKGP